MADFMPPSLTLQLHDRLQLCVICGQPKEMCPFQEESAHWTVQLGRTGPGLDFHQRPPAWSTRVCSDLNEYYPRRKGWTLPDAIGDVATEPR